MNVFDSLRRIFVVVTSVIFCALFDVGGHGGSNNDNELSLRIIKTVDETR